MPAFGEIQTSGFATTERIWDALVERVEAFVAAADQGQRPKIADHLPTAPATFRRLTLCELIKVDLEYAHREGESARRIEDYAREFPELAGDIPCDLIYEEYHVRKGRGDEVTPDEYFARFPRQADELRRLMGVEDPVASTSLYSGTKLDEIDVGQSIDDFDLLTRLGRGAFATVFLARQRSMQRLVALKISADRGHEPQTLAQLDHPNIVRVYDQRVAGAQSWRLMYMQYIAGGSLQEAIEHCRETPFHERSGKTLLAAIDRILDRRGEIPPTDSSARQRIAALSWPQTVAWLGMQLAMALDYAHRRQVLHRDLKPANILLAADGTPKLVDFNISYCSKLAGATPVAYFGGSLAYMSPEQLEACSPKHERKADSLDGRADLYSLGVLLWELLTGGRPFRDEPSESGWLATLEEMIERRREGLPSNTRSHAPAECPEELVDVISICLAPQASDRPQTGAELTRQLRVCVQPSARRFFRPVSAGLVGWARRWPFVCVTILALLPNAIAGVFNFAYNRAQIVERLGDSQDVFWRVQGVINSVAFPLGIALIASFTWPVTRRVRASVRSSSAVNKDAAAPEELARLRGRALCLGRVAALVSAVEWLIAGFIYPAVMHFLGLPLSFGDYLHFIGSLALCGLIAAVYPFFGITAVSLRAFVPSLMKRGQLGADDMRQITQLQRTTSMFWGLAASLPMLGVLLVMVMRWLLGGQDNPLPLVALSIAGTLGFGIAFVLARSIQRDLAALADLALDPADSATLIGTDTVRSTWM